MNTVRQDVAWTLELDVRDGRLDEVRALAAEMSAATHAGEPGALEYEWNLSDDGRTVHLFERYADSASALVHLGTFTSRFMTRFLELLAPTRFVIYGTPDQKVREAVAAFGPLYLAPAAGFRR
jgi:quinol monooxygenase YgiN